MDEVHNFYGQESNPSTYNLARMNMILHDVHFSRFDIQQDDTLENPHHLDKRFEAVVANPPFSLKNWGHSVWSKGDPFGRDTFHQNLRDLNGPSIHLLFTGENANEISPKTKLCL